MGRNNKVNKTYLTNFPIVKFVRENIGMLSALAILVIVFACLSEYFLGQANIINIFRQISINAIIAFGMTCVLLTGGIDLSVGAVAALSGCTIVGLINMGYGFGLALLAGLLLGAFVGAINGTVIAIAKLPSFIVTLGMMNIARGVAYLYSDGEATPLLNKVYPEASNLFNKSGNGYLLGVPIPILIMIIAFIFLVLVLNKTRFGRNIYALGGNRECARFSGIKIVRTEIGVYTLNGLYTALAGLILMARMGSGQPMVGEGYELDAIAAVVLGGTSFTGGKGKIGGTLIGALVLGVFSNGLNLIQVSYYWQLVVKGLIIITAVYIDAIKNMKRSRPVAVHKEDKETTAA